MKIDLINIYSEIHNCHICPKMDKEKVCRNIEKTNMKSDVLIILQALAENTMRKSGVNFYYSNETMSTTGLNLEKFLNKINRTVVPNKIGTVYSTDIIQCFPGKIGNFKKGDRKPSKVEILNCIKYLKKEIQIIQPKLIILVGSVSCESFYKNVMNNESIKFSDKVCVIDKYNNANIVSIYHPSGLSRGFYPMLKNDLLFKSLNELLNN